MAQLIGLQEDSAGALAPFQVEMRRRLWWHICGLESRGAEEGSSRQSSIQDNANVKFPANLNDADIFPDIASHPQPRSGVTEMTCILLRFEIVRLTNSIMKVKRRHALAGEATDAELMKAEQKKELMAGKLHIERTYQQYLHPTRALDWLGTAWIEAMLVKARLAIDYPFGQLPTKDMTQSERMDLLQASVDILRMSNALLAHKSSESWAWFYRGWVQWHAIAVVIAELGHNTDHQFVDNAWAVLDPILTIWDSVYKVKQDEPAWEHVNTLIERARQKRQQLPSQSRTHAATARPAFEGGRQDDLYANSNTGTVAGTPSIAVFGAAALPWRASIGDNPPVQGPIPGMPGLDSDFSFMEGWDGIDLSAFEGVFGDVAWDFSSPSTDWSMGNVVS